MDTLHVTSLLFLYNKYTSNEHVNAFSVNIYHVCITYISHVQTPVVSNWHNRNIEIHKQHQPTVVLHCNKCAFVDLLESSPPIPLSTVERQLNILLCQCGSNLIIRRLVKFLDYTFWHSQFLHGEKLWTLR